jgi:radical SAM superfamily enzyme YgiQ (UPF0313 family)
MTTHDYTPWFEKSYPELSGYGLWLRGGELNTLPPAEFEARAFRVLIARLSTYRDTADSFTHKLLYQIASRIDGVYLDLAYLPPPKDCAVFDRDNVPWLLGTTSKRGARDFSMIALSDSIVQELVNIPALLKKSAIPLSKIERMGDESLPFVIMGGASALFASSLFNDDPLVDGIFIGEDARVIGRIFRIGAEGRAQGRAKAAILAELAEVPGFVLPDGDHTTRVFQAAELPAEQLLQEGPVLYNEGSLGKGNLQLSEGCACFCSFCAESFTRKPYREVGAATLRAAALLQKARMGVDDLELYSFNFNMHRDFYRILADLSPLFSSLGLKSQRFDSIAHDPELLAVVHAAGKSSITCGLEGISPRLRRYLHKSLSERDLDKSLSRLLAAPLRELKIFLVATGLEQDEDYEEFRKLLASMESVMRATERRPRIIFSMTILVRFPWTPLEFEDAPDARVGAGVLHRTGQLAHAAGFEFRPSADTADYWLSQLLVRAADPRIGHALRNAQEETGFVYYREIPESFIAAFKRALEREGIGEAALLKGSAPRLRHTKPWCGIKTGVDESFLIRQWEAARAFADEGYCAGTKDDEGECFGCGACGSAKAKNDIIAKPAARTFSTDVFRAHLRAAKQQTSLLGFRMRMGERLRGVPRKAAGVALARACMLADERLVEAYRGFGGSLVFTTFATNWIVGDDELTLLWDGAHRGLVRALAKEAAFIRKVNDELAGWGFLEGCAQDAPPEIGAIDFSSPFQFDPAVFCKNRALKYTQVRAGENGYRYEMSKESLKKKIVVACSTERQADGSATVSVVPGPKFKPEEFAQTAFKLPTPQEWVRIVMEVRFKGEAT